MNCVEYSAGFLLNDIDLDLIDCSHQKAKWRKAVFKEGNLEKAFFRSVKSLAVLAVGR